MQPRTQCACFDFVGICVYLNSVLENFGFVLRDCSKAISINPRSSKAHYRSAVALLALERFEEALDCCTRCLDFDPSNTNIRQLLDRAQKSKLQKDKETQVRFERLQREAVLKRELRQCFKVSVQCYESSLLALTYI